MISMIFLLNVVMFSIGIALSKKKPLTSKILLTISIGVCLFFVSLVPILILAFDTTKSLPSILSASTFITLYTFILSFIWKWKKPVKITLTLLWILSIILAGYNMGYRIYESNLPELPEPDVYSDYNYESEKVIDIETDFQITEDLPRLDGATALYPIYTSIAKSIYPESEIVFFDEQKCKEQSEVATAILKNKGSSGTVRSTLCDKRWNKDVIDCTKTTEAYRRIVDGETDIIFVAGPSKKQEEYAKEKGVELVYTPIGKEAFVFFVNSKNKINNLSIEQIQDIYSGKTTKWSDLGVKRLGDIKAFQRAEGSGSQTALQKVMAGKNLMEAPQEDVVELMGGIINRTADYKNYKNAIGFSFRFYSTEMVQNDQIKLLSLNGVAPTLENIENGTYPIASEFFAVTRKDATENTKKIVEWLQTKEAQEIIKRVGYTPLY